VVSFTPQPLYSLEKSLQYPLNRRLDDEDKRKFFTLPELELRASRPSSP
jgi:hypothetical protein